LSVSGGCLTRLARFHQVYSGYLLRNSPFLPTQLVGTYSGASERTLIVGHKRGQWTHIAPAPAEETDNLPRRRHRKSGAVHRPRSGCPASAPGLLSPPCGRCTPGRFSNLDRASRAPVQYSPTAEEGARLAAASPRAAPRYVRLATRTRLYRAFGVPGGQHGIPGRPTRGSRPSPTAQTGAGRWSVRLRPRPWSVAGLENLGQTRDGHGRRGY